MARHEVRRFVYMCDGLLHEKQRCGSVQVVDAATERDADQIARTMGWEVIDSKDRKKVFCKEKAHRKYNHTSHMPDTDPTEWMRERGLVKRQSA